MKAPSTADKSVKVRAYLTDEAFGYEHWRAAQFSAPNVPSSRYALLQIFDSEAERDAAMERTRSPLSAEILSSERRTPNGPRDTPFSDRSSPSPTHGGTPQETNDQQIAKALGNCYMMAKREIARILNGKSQTDALSLERWQHVQRFCEETGLKSSILRATLPTEITEGSESAHGGTAPHPEICICGHPRSLHACSFGAYGATPCRCSTFTPVEAGTAAASLSQNVNKEKKDQEG